MSDDRNIVDEEDLRALEDAASLPMDWTSGGQTIAQQQLIRKPTRDQLKTFSKTRIRTCGDCKHMSKAGFREVGKKFMAWLVHEAEWNPAFLGAKPSELGRCGQEPDKAVAPHSLACDAFRAK